MSAVSSKPFSNHQDPLTWKLEAGLKPLLIILNASTPPNKVSPSDAPWISWWNFSSQLRSYLKPSTCLQLTFETQPSQQPLNYFILRDPLIKVITGNLPEEILSMSAVCNPQPILLNPSLPLKAAHWKATPQGRSMESHPSNLAGT